MPQAFHFMLQLLEQNIKSIIETGASVFKVRATYNFGYNIMSPEIPSHPNMVTELHIYLQFSVGNVCFTPQSGYPVVSE